MRPAQQDFAARNWSGDLLCFFQCVQFFHQIIIFVKLVDASFFKY